MKYRAITANCGNDAIGIKASEAIASSLRGEDADFYIINCQEVSMNETLEQLKKAVGEGYTVSRVAQMATHTKLATQFHSHTGVATFIIHKNDLELKTESTILARRSHSRLSGSGYNKGGLVTDFTVIKNKGSADEERLHVQTVSGHLDSNNIQKRAKDWYCINRAIAKKAYTWQDLVAVCPNVRVSGYDANTRNRFTTQGESVNLWRFSGGTNTPELQALYQAAIAGQHFSTASTYKTNKDDVTTIADSKRPGYAKGGMLDFVGIADGRASSMKIQSEGITRIAVDPNDSERDHDIIISPLQEYTMPVSDFEKVKGQMAQRLERNAPQLAQEIKALAEDNEENRNKLLSVYRHFLSPKGSLNQEITLQVEKLGFLKEFTALAQDKQIKEAVVDILFPMSPWFEDARMDNLEQFVEQYKQKTNLIHLFMGSMHPYPGATETNQRVQLFTEQLQDIKNQNYRAEQAQQAFKDMQIQEYDAFYSRLVNTLNEYEPDTADKKALQKQGRDILENVKTIVPNKEKLKELSLHEIAQINSVLKHCSDGIDILNKGGDIKPIASQLAYVAQNVSAKTSPGWKSLGANLLVFAALALVVAGVLAAIPTGGSSLVFAAIGAVVVGAVAGVAGVKALSHNPEKQLAKSIGEYKSALQTLAQEESLNEENPSITSSKTS